MSGIADGLRKYRDGDTPTAAQWNLLVDCARRDVTGAGVFRHAGGWDVRRLPGQGGQPWISWGIIVDIDLETPNIVMGRRVSWDAEVELWVFDEDADPEQFQCEPGIGNVDYGPWRYDDTSSLAPLLLRLYQMPGDSRIFIEQKIAWPMLPGEPENPVTQCQIAMTGGMFG